MPPQTTAAIVIPVYKKSVTALEELSLSRCTTVFKDYPLVFVGPRSLDFHSYRQRAENSFAIPFDDSFFASWHGYNRLMLTRDFYESLAAYEYVLIYQLDAFVFRDRLLYWCDKGFDYIGAPLQDKLGRWAGVGNGGFSLRRTRSFLEAFRINAKENAQVYWSYIRNSIQSPWQRALRYHRKIAKHFGIASDMTSFLRRYARKGHWEDMFWGMHAVRYQSSFRVAPVEEAIRFSIEAGLEEAYPYYSEEPPFGCHRNWYLEAIHRYLHSGDVAQSNFEALVWDLAKKAGLARHRVVL